MDCTSHFAVAAHGEIPRCDWLRVLSGCVGNAGQLEICFVYVTNFRGRERGEIRGLNSHRHRPIGGVYDLAHGEGPIG